MSTKYKFLNPSGIYFITIVVVDWIDIFMRNVYKDIVIDRDRVDRSRNIGIYDKFGWINLGGMK